MDTMKIVCMGDSLTEGILVLPTANWPYLLSQKLGVEVINSGISGPFLRSISHNGQH